MSEPSHGALSGDARNPDVSAADARLDAFSLLADTATRLLTDEQPEAVAPDLYALLAAHLDLDIFLNYMVEGDTLRLASCEGIPDSIRANITQLAFGEAACGTAALRRKPVIAERLQETADRVYELLRDLGVRAYACHPLLAGQQLIGTLAFASRTRDGFAPHEIRLMSTVANQAAVAIERGRLLMAHARDQEERRSAESSLMKALQDSEARLRTVLDILPVGVFIADEHGRIILANRSADRIWGHPPLAAAREDYAAYRGRWAATGRPVAPHEWGLPRAISGEESLDREIEIEAADCERRTILNSALPIRDGSGRIVGGVAVDVDITERKRAEDALRRSEATLAQAGKMASLGAWQIDFAAPAVNDNPLRWSDEVYRIFGYEPGEVTVTNELFFSHVHPEDRQRVQDEVARAIAEHRPYAIEHRIVRRDGCVRVVAEHADIRFTEGGEPRAMTGAVQDITERKQAEEALREADRRKNEFLATLSHELRNPLAAIRYALELFDAPTARSIGDAHPKEVIERQLRHLVHLVDDLLDITRIESNKVRLRKSHVELRTVLQQAIEAADPAIKGADHELAIDVPFDAIWLDADADRLAQVVTNLLNNAARYTAAGGRISVTARASGDQVRIAVADTGIGLASDDLGRVFEMFTQVGENGSGGLGIGLALVRRLVEMHGGTVEARSDGPGAGSEFIVRLPQASTPRAPAATSVPDRAQLQRHRILVVEDNNDAAEMIAMLLRLRGDEVCVAAYGPTALKLATTFLPDIGLFDIGLPGMSGYELASRIRQLPSLERMFLVAITGWGQDEDRTRAREAGFDAHLTKPAEPDAIERMIARSSARP